MPKCNRAYVALRIRDQTISSLRNVRRTRIPFKFISRMVDGAEVLADLPPSRAIPNSITESFRSWWAVGPKGSASSEQRLLRKLPFYYAQGAPVPHTTPAIIAQSSFVHLSNPAQYINTLSMLPASPFATTPPVILLHGYGAGLGFYFRNLAALGSWAERRRTPVYVLDWLGMGRSARVPFKVNAKREDIACRVAEAEGFFVDSLEEWREKMGLQCMTLVGHSLGAYLSVVYALRYPERVARLILLSPAGVPHNPDEASRTPTPEPGVENNAKIAPLQRLIAAQKAEKQRDGRLRRLAMHLWEEGWSPFQIVRSLMFFGPMLVGKYSARRFSGLTEEETRDMHDYILNITLAKGSGEYCVSHILAPGAYARMPLVDRVTPLKMPITFVYGDHDWMDPRGGKEALENLRAAGNYHSNMYTVPAAGHHVYLDNPEALNELLVKELDQTVG